MPARPPSVKPYVLVLRGDQFWADAIEVRRAGAHSRMDSHVAINVVVKPRIE